MKTAYTFTVLRYLHDVVSDEFVNIGVVMYASETRFLKARMRTTIGRIKSLFPDLERHAYVSAVQSARQGFQKLQKDEGKALLALSARDAGSIAREALPSDDSALQWSTIGSGIADDLEQTFERLFARYVSRYDEKTAHRKTDDEVWKPVLEKLAAKDLRVPLDEKIIIGATDTYAFKHAWKNGDWHAYEPVSLDLADADNIKDKARKVFGHLSAVEDGVTEKVKLNVLVGAPQNAALMPAYRNAIQILQKAPFDVQVFEESEIDHLVDKIEDEFRAHS